MNREPARRDATGPCGLVQAVIHTIGTARPGALDLVEDGLFHRLRAVPEIGPDLDHLTGLDAEVADQVLGSPEVMLVIERIAESAKAVLDAYADPRRRLVHITIASRTGRHRSVAVAECVAQYLTTAGVRCETRHHHLARPAVEGDGFDDLVTGPGDPA